MIYLFSGGRGRSFADVGTWGAPSVEIIGEVGVSDGDMGGALLGDY